jgi:hypothetical protein
MWVIGRLIVERLIDQLNDSLTARAEADKKLIWDTAVPGCKHRRPSKRALVKGFAAFGALIFS